MLRGPVFAGGKKEKERKKNTKRGRDGGVEGKEDGEETRDGDQGMDVFTLYLLFF
jgi:hypothetical protein